MNIKMNKLLITIYSIIALYFIMQVKSVEQIVSIILLTTIIFILNVFIIKNEKMEVYKKFGCIGLILGIIFLLFIPILHGIDEGAHFFKVYSFFYDVKSHYNDENILVDEVPEIIIRADMIENIQDSYLILNEKINDEKTIASQEYIGAKLYSPISYITYLIPVFLLKNIFKLNIFWIIVFGRLVSFCTWLLITMYTIKIIPRKKEFFASLCLLPIVLSIVTTFTGDLVNNAAVFLFIAFWYKLYVEKRQIKKSEIFIITILGIITTCSKMVYALMFLLLFLLPEEIFKSKKNKYLITTGIILVLVITFFVNMSFVGNDLFEAYPAINEQKEFIKDNIFQYIYIFIKTIITNFPMYLYQFTTGKTTMCQNAIYVDNVISMFYWIILISTLLSEDNEIKLNKKSKIFIIGIVITMISIIFLSLYLQWTATNYGIGYHLVMGVQGRYFIPISALLIFNNNKKKININKNLLWTSMILMDFIIILKIMMMFLI